MHGEAVATPDSNDEDTGDHDDIVGLVTSSDDLIGPTLLCWSPTVMHGSIPFTELICTRANSEHSNIAFAAAPDEHASDVPVARIRVLAV